jgi:hypothetical protein
MQANPLRAALERGELQIGTWVNLVRNPAILPLLKAAGLDFARVDMEHTGASIEAIANLALLSRALNFPIAVRPPKANRSGSRGCSTSAYGTCTARRSRTPPMPERLSRLRATHLAGCAAMRATARERTST